MQTSESGESPGHSCLLCFIKPGVGVVQLKQDGCDPVGCIVVLVSYHASFKPGVETPRPGPSRS